jgi:NAD-dependent DNA ligase
MIASNKLGRGVSGKTIEQIMENEPTILISNDSPEQKYEKLVKIKGIGEVNAKTFIKNIPAFMNFLHECGLNNKMQFQSKKSTHSLEQQEALDTSHPLYNKKIVMTKVRDKDIIEYLKEVGGILEDNIKSDTFVLIVKSKEDSSSKMVKAQEKGIAIMTPQEFKDAFII